MKKVIASVLVFILISALCVGCGDTKTEDNIAKEELTSETEPEETPVLEGKIAPKEDLEESDITVPNYLQGEETDNLSALEEGEEETVYHMSGGEQIEAANQIASEIENSINEVLANKEYYPNITGISVNEECTEFNVTFSSRDISLYENTLQMSLCIVGNKFQLYQGKSEDELMTVVNYIDNSNGEIFFTANSGNIA